MLQEETSNMKKRLLLFGLILTASCALSSCDLLFPSGSDQYSYRPTDTSDHSTNPDTSTSTSTSSDSQPSTSSSSGSSTSSSKKSSSSSSEQSAPPAGSLTPKKASYNYKDYTNNNLSKISSTPCVGTAKLLVVPIWFTDSDNFISKSSRDNIRSDIETTYFGSNQDTGWRSVKTYYEEESHGALQLYGTVSNWYECKKSYTYYKTDGSVTRTRALVKEAADWFFEKNAGESRKDYDRDGNGYLDGVMLIYAAPDQQSLQGSSYESGDNLWAYCFWVQNTDYKNVSSPGPNVFFWASYDFMYSKGTKALQRTGYASQFGHGDTLHSNLDAHTYIHEMGHVFGLDDYYDYSDNNYRPAGSFSMQDHNVGGHDPYSSFALGWGKAYIPTETTNIDLKPFTESGEMILLSPSFNSDNSPFDEYLLLEYYTTTGLNEMDTKYKYSNGPTGSKDPGIRLWHVDARLIYPTGYNGSGGYTYSFATNPSVAGHIVTHAMTNTYDDGKADHQDYLSYLGSGYYNYNLLQLIRNDSYATYCPKDELSTNSLFKTGSTFTMDKCKTQFVNTGKLNSNKTLGFSFTVNALNENRASITVTKL